MVKFKFKPSENTSLDDIEKELKYLAGLNVPEIPFKHICRIAEYLGTEMLPSKGGSARRFRHQLLTDYSFYHDGIFKIDLIHGGKSDPKVRTRDFKRYLLVPLREIIKRLKEEGKKK